MTVCTIVQNIIECFMNKAVKGSDIMKNLITVMIFILSVLTLNGCSNPSTTETDYSYDRGSYSPKYDDTPTEKENDNGWNKENWDRVTDALQEEIDKTR